MPEKKKPLWTCPKCGHQFVTLNMWHSCSRHSLDDHFKGKASILRKIFDRYLALVKKCGPVTVYAQKTRIIFQVRVRFAGAVIKKNWVEGGLWLKRKVEHPRFFRIESPTPRDHIHRFRLAKLEEIDDELAAFIREAYAVGCQEYLDKKSVDQFFDQIKDKEPMVKLIRRQLKNSRNATKKVAEKFVKKQL